MKHLARVQVLRFFAAFAVLAAHLEHEVVGRIAGDPVFSLRRWIDGGIGVDMFFLISGFIMYHISAKDFGRPRAPRLFAERRFLRVAPLYYLATLLMLLAAHVFAGSVASQPLGAGQILASFLFIPCLNGEGQVAPILKLGWTLNYEVFFYACFAIALAFPRRIGVTLLFGGLLALVAIAHVVPRPPLLLAFWGNDIIVEFLGGMLIAMLSRQDVRLGRIMAWGGVVAGLGLAIFFRRSGLIADLPRSIFGGVPAALIVGCVVLAPALETRGRLMRALAFGGDASYALYLSHPFSIRAATILCQHAGITSAGVFFVVTLLSTLIVAAALHLWVERPLSRLFRREVPRGAAPDAREMA